MELGEPKPRRKEIIASLDDEKPHGHESLEFQGQYRSLAVHLVRIGLPRYRLKNGRTIAAQEDVLAQKPDLPEDLFKDTESERAQREQHKILANMVKGTELARVLSKGKQHEALILNGDGIVINGNRRLSWMRELLDKDPRRYSSYEHIRVAILPDADEKDIYEYEVKEQIKPEVKARYNWIQTAKMLKRGLNELRLTERDLAHIHEMKVPQIKQHLELLQAAEEYLADRGKPRQYHLVEGERHAFDKIVKGRKALKDEGSKQAFSEISYLLLENPQPGIGRLYDAIPRVQKNLAEFIEAIQEEVDLPEADEKEQARDEDLELLGGGGDASIADRIAEAAAVPEKREQVLTAVVDSLQHVQQRESHRQRAGQVLRKVKAANQTLNEAKIALDHDSKLDGVAEQLESIEASVKSIRTWLEEHASG